MTAYDPKVFGFKLPASVDAGSSVSVTLCFPDILEYRAAFNGQINMLGKWFQWAHTQSDYQDIPELNKQVAELWVQVLTDATWGACMDICSQIIECITTDPLTQEAIVNSVLNSTAFQNYIRNNTGAGGALPGPEIERPIVSNCDEDSLFGAATAIYDAMNQANIDLLERVEVGTNPAERVQLLVSAIPILETLPIDEGLELADQLIEQLFENYVAESTSALRNEIRCDLFCMALDNPDCYINFQDLFDYFSDKLGGSVDTDTLFRDGMLYIASGVWTGNQVVYAMMLLQTLIWRWSSSFLGLELLSLAKVAQTADPDPDWEILCDCVTPPGDRTPVINSLWDPTHTAGSITGPDEDGFWTATSGTRASDEAITLMDVDDRDFVLTEITFEDTPQCEVYLLDGTLIYIGCGSGNVYAGQTIDEFTVTWFSGAHRTMRFKMVAPE